MMSMLKILGVCVTLPLYLDIPGVFGGMSTEVLFLIEKKYQDRQYNGGLCHYLYPHFSPKKSINDNMT